MLSLFSDTSPNPTCAECRVYFSLEATVLCSRIVGFGLYLELPLSTDGGIAARLTIASQKYAVVSPFIKSSLSDAVIVIGLSVEITYVIVW